RSRLVLSSSIVTRRPRSAMRSMGFPPGVRTRLASSPALPHAQFEYRKIAGAQQTAGRQHDVGAGNRMLRHRSELLASLGARAIDPAGGGDQRLQRIRADE